MQNLFNINFLGFRGEALPSIASVSRLSIISRPQGADSAWKIEVNGGVKSKPVPASHPFGTRIEVRDLFYATPARLKFLKAAVSETNACVDILTQVQAVSSALNAFSKTLLSNHIKTCVVDDIRDGKEESVDELCKTIQKLMK